MNRSNVQMFTGVGAAYAPDGRVRHSRSSYLRFGELHRCVSCEQHHAKLIDHWTGHRVCTSCYITKRGILG